MKSKLLAILLVGITSSAHAWECNETQQNQGCYTYNLDNSGDEGASRCLIDDDTREHFYICPICQKGEHIKIETSCKTVNRGSCNPMVGCSDDPETVCQGHAVCTQ